VPDAPRRFDGLAVVRTPDPTTAVAVRDLAARVSAAEDRIALREQQDEALDRGGPGWTGLLQWSPARDRAVGYAGVLREGGGWAVEDVVERDRDAAPLLLAALEVVAEAGGGLVQRWRSSPSPESDREAVAAGLRRWRDILEIRRPLPVGEAWSLPVRAFVPGRDEEAWLAVNNRAFAWHPEQGGWDLETILGREREPWFDPSGFLIHERDGRMAGFCWTKVHRDEDPPVGEIYVIAVDPDFEGLGLGRSLVLAGLDHLAGRGLTIGMLYVDEDNTRARAVYERLGFVLHHVDRAYATDVVPV
jgi:mycothiol synthase